MHDEKTNELRDYYQEWFFNRTVDEDTLFGLICEFEDEYFDDMQFKQGSVISPFIECEELIDGEWIKTVDCTPFDYVSITSMRYRLKVESLEKAFAGQCNAVDKIITISSEHLHDKSVVLHEMIHAYEFYLNEKPVFYRDMLFLSLYNNLREKIGDLDSRIMSHGHNVFSMEILNYGGIHSILFFLKSLDLDLRCGFKLGTVCGYGRDKDNTKESE